MDKVAKSVAVGIDVDTEQVDEAIEKAKELSDVLDDMSPMVSIRGCRDCVFNIYPSNYAVKNYGGAE